MLEIEKREWNADHKLKVVFNNTRPVELIDLTQSLLSLSEQYQKFVESNISSEYKVGTKLLITEVKSGSISIELISEVLPILPIIWSNGPFAEWIKYTTEVIGWVLEKAKKKPDAVTEHDLKQWNHILEPVCKDSGSQINFIASEGAQQIVNFNISSQEANAAQNKITKIIETQREPSHNVSKRQVLVWHQAKFEQTTTGAGDRVIIEEITASPVKVVFEDQRDKMLIMEGVGKFNKPWQKLAYLVDVEVQRIQSVPKLYKILRLYNEDTFDPYEQYER